MGLLLFVYLLFICAIAAYEEMNRRLMRIQDQLLAVIGELQRLKAN